MSLHKLSYLFKMKLFWIEKRKFWLFIAGACLIFLTNFYAALSHKPLMNDGAHWFFMTLHQGWYIDLNYLRRFSLVLELPASLLLYFRPETSARTLIYILDFCFQFHPVVSLIGSWLILQKARRTELFIFPLFSYSIATLSTIGFAVGVVPESLSLFWPLLLLMTLFEVKTWKVFTLVSGLILSMSFTYELSFFLLAILAFDQWKTGVLYSNKLKKWVFALLCLSIVFLLFRIVGPHQGDKSLFWISVKTPIYQFRRFTFLALIYFLISLFWMGRPEKTRASKILIFLFVMTSVYYSYTFLDLGFDFASGYPSRVTAIPVAFFIACAYLFRLRKINPNFQTNAVLKRAPKMIVAISLLVASWHEVQDTRMWKSETRYFLEKMEAAEGCVEFHEPGHVMVSGWSLPYLSILLQESRHVRFVAFDPFRSQIPYCDLFRKGYLTDGLNTHQIAPPAYLDFTNAIQSARTK